MKIKTNELTGAVLDWAAAKCEGVEVEYINDGITRCLLRVSPFTGRYSPSTAWTQGGPIIERHISRLDDLSDYGWEACEFEFTAYGPTPLIAAMRCYVASKLGDEVEIPDELIKE